MNSTLLVLLLVLAAVLAVGLVTVFLIKLSQREQVAEENLKGLSYESCEALLSPAELSFFNVLEQAVGNQLRVFAKVRLADIVKPSRCENRSQWQTAFNRISRKHLDFVICEPKIFRVVGVIELDDKSHERVDRKERDGQVDEILSSAGIRILHVHARATYSPIELSAQINRAF